MHRSREARRLSGPTSRWTARSPTMTASDMRFLFLASEGLTQVPSPRSVTQPRTTFDRCPSSSRTPFLGDSHLVSCGSLKDRTRIIHEFVGWAKQTTASVGLRPLHEVCFTLRRAVR